MSEVHIENLVLDCNRLALENLSKGNGKACIHLLRRAQDLLNTPNFPESRERLMVITYNNLGCYHKANQKYNLALQAYQKALDLRSDFILDKHQAAEVHINICFIREVFSQYDYLVLHSKRALELLSSCQNLKKGVIPLAHLHIGKGFIGLGNKQSASLHLKKGLDLAYKELGHSHPTTAELLKLYLTLPSDLQREPSKKKYVFDHHFGQNDFFKVKIGEETKKSPVKADKRLVDGIYFEEIDKKKIERPCRHIPSSAKSTRDSSKKYLNNINSKKQLNNTGRFTPEAAFRNLSSSSSSRTEALPKLRASSSRPKNPSFDLNTSNEIPKPPVKPKPPSSARSAQYRRPSKTEMRIKTDLIKPKPLYDLSKIIKIQKNWRGFLDRKKVKSLRRQEASKKAKKAVAELEELKKMVRFENYDISDIYKERLNTRESKRTLSVIKEVKAEYSAEPIILIQKNVRMFIHRKKFAKVKKAAVKVQSFIRMANVRELYINILNAIIFIQRTWRRVKKINN